MKISWEKEKLRRENSKWKITWEKREITLFLFLLPLPGGRTWQPGESFHGIYFGPRRRALHRRDRVAAWRFGPTTRDREECSALWWERRRPSWDSFGEPFPPLGQLGVHILSSTGAKSSRRSLERHANGASTSSLPSPAVRLESEPEPGCSW